MRRLGCRTASHPCNPAFDQLVHLEIVVGPLLLLPAQIVPSAVIEETSKADGWIQSGYHYIEGG